MRRGAQQLLDRRRAGLRSAYRWVLAVAMLISFAISVTALLMGLRADRKITLAPIGSFFPILLVDLGRGEVGEGPLALAVLDVPGPGSGSGSA